MRYLILILAAGSLLCGCAAIAGKDPAVSKYKPDTSESAQERRDLMVGNWLGKAPLKEGGKRLWLVQRSNEGTFVVTFVVIPEGEKPEISQEVGFWGISGPVYFSMTKGWLLADGSVQPSDPTEAHYYDAYRIIELNEQVFEYESFIHSNRFSVEKLPDEFTPQDLIDSIDEEA